MAAKRHTAIRIAGIDGREMLALRGAQAGRVLSVEHRDRVACTAPREGRARPRPRLDRHARGPPRARARARAPDRRWPGSRLPDADLVHPVPVARGRGVRAVARDSRRSTAARSSRIAGGRGPCSATAGPARARCSRRSRSRGTRSGRRSAGDRRRRLLRRSPVHGPEAGCRHGARPGRAAVRSLDPAPAVGARALRGRFTLRGCIYLEWGDRVAAEPLAPAEHLGAADRAAPNRGTRRKRRAAARACPGCRRSACAGRRRPGGCDATREALIEAVRRTYSYFSPLRRAPART